jgi:uncharacterized protein (TIGR02466 family)
MNPQSINLFRADVFITNVGTLSQRQLLIDEIKNKQQLYPDGIDKSNFGCWRFNNPCANIDWLMFHIMNLLDQATAHYNQEDRVFAQRKNLELVNVDYWANINLPQSRNSMHSHKPAQFSACYYLQAEDTGLIRFVNPANIMAECNPAAPFTADTAINPRDGDLLLWPSWVPHEVETNFSNNERINLAFDIKIKY